MAKTFSVILVGVEVVELEIETVLGAGFSGLSILGLPSDTARETRERVRSSLEKLGLPVPARRITVNVTPAHLIKLARSQLSLLDFAIAASVCLAMQDDAAEEADACSRPQHHQVFAGELALSGELRPLPSLLMFESLALRNPEATFHLAGFSARPADTAGGRFFFHDSLRSWLESLQGDMNVSLHNPTSPQPDAGVTCPISDERLAEVESVGRLVEEQPQLFASLMAAAAGRHHVLFAGEPGIGKSFALGLLARLQPPLSVRESVECRLIDESADLKLRPARTPHHSSTAAALIGGSNLRPGEVTLAHCGMLVLDELAEFTRPALEALREPLDNGRVVLSRAAGTVSFPARFQLVAATNPCPCGYQFSRRQRCRCSHNIRRNYLRKLSGPLLDRFALQIWLDTSRAPQATDVIAEGLIKAWRKDRRDFCRRVCERQRDARVPGSPRPLRVLGPEVQLRPRAARSAGQASECARLPSVHSSQRARLHLADLSETFLTLAPELAEQDDFSDDLAHYRALDALFASAGS